jgi:multicomponent Na+:H+ antiporter subunit E
MSETTVPEHGAPRRSGRLRVLQLPAIVWLTVVWVALWGELSLLMVVGGALVAVIVCLVFPLPRLPMGIRIHPLRLIWLVVHFLGDVVVASAQVAWATLQFRRTPRNAVIEVDLRTDSDLILTMVAEMVSLVPGSLVVEARRSTHTLFLHVLDVRDDAGVAKMRRQVDALEGRVERALAAVPRDSQEVGQ